MSRDDATITLVTIVHSNLTSMKEISEYSSIDTRPTIVVTVKDQSGARSVVFTLLTYYMYSVSGKWKLIESDLLFVTLCSIEFTTPNWLDMCTCIYMYIYSQKFNICKLNSNYQPGRYSIVAGYSPRCVVLNAQLRACPMYISTYT